MGIRNWFHRRPERDIEDEIRSHLAMAAADRVDRGLSPDDARLSARREFGSAALIAETARAVWRRPWLDQLGRDLCYGLRTLRQSPLYAAVAIFTLALGIGATSAIFSVVNAVLVKGLPYPHLDRLVFITEKLPKTPLNVAWPDYLDWRAQNTVFDGIAVFQPNRLPYWKDGAPADVSAALVSSSFFSTLGIRMPLGRPIEEADERAGAPLVAVLSYRFWRNELKADPNIIGRTIRMAGARTVIGVLAPEFRLDPWQWSAYLPIAQRAGAPDFVDRGNHPGLMVIARMRPGITLSRARSDLATIMDRLGRAYPASNRGETAVVRMLSDRLLGDVRPTLLLLLGAVGLVLLMACANVAHLALARTASRQREFAIRASLGAGRVRLLRQLAIENGVLSLLGGAAGILLAFWTVPSVVKLYPEKLPGLADAAVDSHVLLFALGACALTSLLFGLGPMLYVTRSGSGDSLKHGAQPSGGPRGRRMRAALFAAEIAIAIVVSIGAGLLVRSFAAVRRVDPGFRADRLLALDVIHPGKRNPQRDFQFFTQAAAQVASQPGVVSASAAMCPPISGTCWTSQYTIPGQPSPDISGRPWTVLNMVLPGYFSTLGTALREGRFFTSADDAASTPVAILNRALARRLWPNESAVGKQLFVQSVPAHLLEVVGVVGNIRQEGLDTPAEAEVFVPAAQMPVGFMTVMARTAGDPAALAPAASQAIRSIEKNQPAPRITAMTETVAAGVARRKFAAFLLGLFGTLGLLLAAVGVSGVMAYTVAERTREFGIRLAVGARQGQVLRMVLRQGLVLAATGIAIGIVAAWELARLLSKMLFGVTVHDPVTFALSALLLFVVALAACLAPAWRAARVDPMRSLRCD
jgi:predicted permease